MGTTSINDKNGEKLMNLEKKLKKMGIEDAKEMKDEIIQRIAYNVSETLIKTFPYLNEEYEKIYVKLINCKMYVAHITKPISRVNYMYENSSIYFDEKMDFNKLDEQTLHECIHYLQEYRNTEGKLIRIGLCNLNEFKVWGLGLNEAIVQYMSAKCFHGNPKLAEKYNIDPIVFEYFSDNCNLFPNRFKRTITHSITKRCINECKLTIFHSHLIGTPNTLRS